MGAKIGKAVTAQTLAAGEAPPPDPAWSDEEYGDWREGRRLDRRARLLDAFVDLIGRVGCDGARIDTVCGRDRPGPDRSALVTQGWLQPTYWCQTWEESALARVARSLLAVPRDLGVEPADAEVDVVVLAER